MINTHAHKYTVDMSSLMLYFLSIVYVSVSWTVIVHADAVTGVEISPAFVCLSVFPHDISKNDAARITKLDVQMIRDEYWKFSYFGVKGQGRRGSLHSCHTCECWLLLFTL